MWCIVNNAFSGWRMNVPRLPHWCHTCAPQTVIKYQRLFIIQWVPVGECGNSFRPLPQKNSCIPWFYQAPCLYNIGLDLSLCILYSKEHDSPNNVDSCGEGYCSLFFSGWQLWFFISHIPCFRICWTHITLSHLKHMEHLAPSSMVKPNRTGPFYVGFKFNIFSNFECSEWFALDIHVMVIFAKFLLTLLPQPT